MGATPVAPVAPVARPPSDVEDRAVLRNKSEVRPYPKHLDRRTRPGKAEPVAPVAPPSHLNGKMSHLLRVLSLPSHLACDMPHVAPIAVSLYPSHLSQNLEMSHLRRTLAKSRSHLRRTLSHPSHLPSHLEVRPYLQT
jgi:hypothetical protein